MEEATEEYNEDSQADKMSESEVETRPSFSKLDIAKTPIVTDNLNGNYDLILIKKKNSQR